MRGEHLSQRVSRLRGHPLDRAEIILVYLAFPLALVGDIAGVTLGAVGWILALLVGAMAFFVVPLPTAAVRTTIPFLAFLSLGVVSLLWTNDFNNGIQELAQFAAVAVAYFAGWRMMGADEGTPLKMSRLSLWLLPAALIVFINAYADGASTLGWIRGGNAARPMVMMLTLLFVMATIGRSRRYTLFLWGAVFLVALASGGRMGVAAMGVILVLIPAIRLSWKGRLALVAVGLAMVAFLIQFEAIQERLFLGREEGELTDIVTLEGNFNTAGRSENWPRVIEECSDEPMIGHGAGSAAAITLQATAGRTPHPHNDYLRIWCEYGYTGSVFFWGFFVLAGLRGLRLYRHRHATPTESELGAAGALVLVALLMFASTDNVVVYTATFMAAAGVIWGITDRALVNVEDRSRMLAHPSVRAGRHAR